MNDSTFDCLGPILDNRDRNTDKVGTSDELRWSPAVRLKCSVERWDIVRVHQILIWT